MAVTYGFYNALAHDRVYDAIQMSSIFDGIIRDGVFSTIGESLICKAPESGLIVNVGAGRAWFNHTWTLNDTDYPVEAEEAEVVLDRIDAVVLEVNSAVEVRANTIKFIKGTPSSNPERPTLTHNAEVNQYALAYVSIRAGQTTIFQSDITNVVGTDETPFVTGVLQQLSIEELVLQWENEFDRHFADFVTINETEFTTWSADMQSQYNAWMTSKMNEYAAWYAQMQTEGDANLAEFDAWFQRMKDQLSTDAAGRLQAEIDQLALEAGKGSVLTVHTINTSLYGRTVTVSQNGQSQATLFDNTGTAVFDNMPYIGEISITSTDGTQTATTTMNIPYFGRYSVNIAFWAATVNITTTSSEFYGLPISVAKDGTTVGSVSFDNAGFATYTAMAPGSYKFTVNYDGMDFDSTIAITEETTYPVILNAWTATLNILTSVTELLSRPITIKKGETIVGTTNFDGSGNATYKVHQTGTYTITSVDTGGNTYEESVAVIDETIYEITLGVPNGATVEPTDDVETWLRCGEVFGKNYTTLAQVLTDEECFAELLGNSNACKYMARSTTWASTILGSERAVEIVNMFDGAVCTLLTNSDWVAAINDYTNWDQILTEKVPQFTSYNVTRVDNGEGFCYPYGVYNAYPYFAFDRSTSGTAYWSCYGGSNRNVYVGFTFDYPVIVTKFDLYPYASGNELCIKNYKIQASNDGSNWDDLYTGVISNSTGELYNHRINIDNTTAYTSYRLLIIDDYHGVPSVYELQFYGRAVKSTTGIIHSCPSDTIYYTSDGTNIPIATTDANGVAEIDFTELDPGIYTLYSTVAKEQVSFTNAYSKQVHITKNTKEVYFMPINYYYWYGRERIPFTTLAIVMFSSGDRWSKSGTINRSTNSMSYQLTNNTAPEGGFVVPNRMTKGLLGKYVKSHYNITKINNNNANFVGALRNSGNKNQNNYYYASLYAQANQDTAIAVDEAYIGFGVDEPGNQNTDIVTLYSLFLQNTY